MACIPSMFLQTLMTENARNMLRKGHCLFGSKQTSCNYFVTACTFQVMASLSKYIWYLEFWLRGWILKATNNKKKVPRSIENPPKIHLWAFLGALLGLLLSLLGSILDTCSQKIGFWRLLGTSWEPKMANLASIPCASHVPPRYKVVMKSRKWRPAGISAAIIAPCPKKPRELCQNCVL